MQNYASVARGPHTWRFGVRLRGQTVDDISRQNFNGTFTFGGGVAPQLDARNQPLPVLVPLTSIERYRRTLLLPRLGLPAVQIRALGGGATQFSLNSGVSEISASQVDVGAFVGDDWRVRSNLSLSLGLRYETQTNVHDWRDFAPRVGVAWAPGAKGGKTRPKSVVRTASAFSTTASLLRIH